MNQLTERTFGESRIRIVTIDGQPWFVAKDACAAMTVVNTHRALSALADDEKGIQRLNTPGGPQNLSVVSESGLYKLILRSDKPEAKRFQDWVTRDVLPAIRKDGGYILGEEKVATGEMSEDELVFRAMEVMRKKIDRLQAENKTMSAELNLVTVDEYRALAHAYWPYGYASKLGRTAMRLCAERSIPVAEQRRCLPPRHPRRGHAGGREAPAGPLRLRHTAAHGCKTLAHYRHRT